MPRSSSRILKPYTAPALTSKDPNKLLGIEWDATPLRCTREVDGLMVDSTGDPHSRILVIFLERMMIYVTEYAY